MYKVKEAGHAACLECGDPIEYGRSDKKFCCEACKNRWHNREASSSRKFRQKVSSSLEKNYFILDSVRRTTLKTILVSDLETMGFRPGYFTSYSKGRNAEVFMCYDLKYVVRNGSVISISKVSFASSREPLTDCTD